MTLLVFLGGMLAGCVLALFVWAMQDRVNHCPLCGDDGHDDHPDLPKTKTKAPDYPPPLD